MKKTSLSVAAAFAALAFAGTASAQVCNGFPTLDGQFSIGAFAQFPEDVNVFGVDGSYNIAGPLALNAGYQYSKVDFEGVESANTFKVGASFDVTSLVGPQPATIQLCPTAELAYTSEDGDALMEIPVGLGFGASLPVSATASLQPYIVPAITFFRASADDVDAVTENRFTLRGGANVTFGQFFVGAEVRKLFGQDDEESFLTDGEGGEVFPLQGEDLVFGVKAGIRI